MMVLPYEFDVALFNRQAVRRKNPPRYSSIFQLKISKKSDMSLQIRTPFSCSNFDTRFYMKNDHFWEPFWHPGRHRDPRFWPTWRDTLWCFACFPQNAFGGPPLGAQRGQKGPPRVPGTPQGRPKVAQGPPKTPQGPQNIGKYENSNENTRTSTKTQKVLRNLRISAKI